MGLVRSTSGLTNAWPTPLPIQDGKGFFGRTDFAEANLRAVVTDLVSVFMRRDSFGAWGLASVRPAP